MTESGCRIEVIDREGWRKEFFLQKPLIHIGSDTRNDIVLESWRGAGVSPRHLQFISTPNQGGAYRLINLGSNDLLLDEGSRILTPHSALELSDGEQIMVGEYQVIFHAGEGSAPGREMGDGVIGLHLSLRQTTLSPDYPLEGVVRLRNQGDKMGVQFKLEVEGVPVECYELGPAPVLFPDAEAEVLLQLIHPRNPTWTAGEHRITIRATAREAYPGHHATVTQVVHVLPFYSHRLRLASVG